MTTPSEYFDRVRSHRNFVAALVLGILAGSLLAIAVERFFSFIEQTSYGPYVPFAVPPLVVLLAYVGVRFSASLETITQTYRLTLDPESFSSLMRATDVQVEKNPASRERRELREKLSSMNSVLGTKAGLGGATVGALRSFHKDLVQTEVVWQGRDKVIAEMLRKLAEMLQTAESIPIRAANLAGEKSGVVFDDKGIRIQKMASGIQARKGFWRIGKIVFRVEFANNMQNSLLIPVICNVATYPLTDFMEQRKLEMKIVHLLDTIADSKEFRELGVECIDLEDAEYWGTMQERVTAPIVEQIQSMPDRIVELIERTEETLGTSPKKTNPVQP